MLNSPELWNYCTPDNFRNMSAERVMFLAIDNFEVPIEHSMNVILQALTYSGKLSHQNTLKICLFVGLDGTIFARCPVYGGGTPEVVPVENWFTTADGKKAISEKVPIVLIADRGFDRMGKIPGVTVWTPHSLSENPDHPQHSTEEVAEMLQQQSLRAAVENSNRRMRIYDFINNIHNTQLGPGIECFIDIIAACANRRLHSAKTSEFTLPPLEDSDYHNRITDIINRHAPPHQPWMGAGAEVSALVASEDQAKLYDLFVDSFPDDWDKLMREKQVRDIRQVAASAGSQSSSVCAALSQLLNFSHATRPDTTIPDTRALALLDSNSVVQLQIGYDGPMEDIVQNRIQQESSLFAVATVQASLRGIQHRVFIRLDAIAAAGGREAAMRRQRSFTCKCTCEVGAAGYCSHAQCTCLMLVYLKIGYLKMRWTKAASKREIDKARPLCPLLAARRAERLLPESMMILPIAMRSHNYDIHPIAVHRKPISLDQAQNLMKQAMGSRITTADHYSCPTCTKHYKVFSGIFLNHLRGINKHGEIVDLGHHSFWTSNVPDEIQTQLLNGKFTAEEVNAMLAPVVAKTIGAINRPAPPPRQLSAGAIAPPSPSIEANPEEGEEEVIANQNNPEDSDNAEIQQRDVQSPVRARIPPPSSTPRPRRKRKAREPYSPDADSE
jgi:hypothetical protein